MCERSTASPTPPPLAALEEKSERRASLIVAVLQLPIRLYQRLLSPLLGQNCRFYPSCSHYALQALSDHGAGRGSWLALKRLLRCHPLNPGGLDPVPPVLTSPQLERQDSD